MKSVKPNNAVQKIRRCGDYGHHSQRRREWVAAVHVAQPFALRSTPTHRAGRQVHRRHLRREIAQLLALLQNQPADVVMETATPVAVAALTYSDGDPPSDS